MRVCILTRGDLFPTQHGAAVKIVRTAQALERAGAEVFLLTDDREAVQRLRQGAFERQPLPPRVRAAEEWPPLPRLARLSHRLCDLVGYPREEHFLYQPIFDPAWWLRALWLGLAERIDVFQAEFPGYAVPGLVAARLVERRTGRRPRVSIVQHNVEWDRLAEFGLEVGRIRLVEQALLRAVDEVIAVSADDRRRMAAAGTPPEKITVIPHGVELRAFLDAAAHGRSVRDRYGLAPNTPLLFFHGTLHYRPNTEAVRFIVEQLLPRLADRPALRVLIAGQGAPAYYAHPQVIFTGPVDDLGAHIAAADLCLCPIESGGGTRMKLLEYMAAGKAVVSTTKGAEGLGHQAGVELRIADGPEAFAAAVRELLDDPPARAALGARAQALARRLDWDRVTAAYLELYQGRGRGQDHGERLRRAPLSPVEAHLPPRLPGKPLTLLLLINRGCNLRCSFCDLWEGHVHMPVAERLLPLLDEAVAIGTRTLVITGGEPFLHPELFLAVREAKRRGLSVNITTNGTRLEARWAETVESGVDSLSFSLDGLEATHDRLRGQKGAWRKTMRALRRVRADGRIAASVYFTANRENVAELVEVYETVRALGARFDFWPVNDAPELAMVEPEAVEAWNRAVTHIAAREAEVSGRLAFYRDSLRYHRGELARVPLRCLGLVDQYGVTYDGELLPCCVWGKEGLRVGNVFQTPLSALWASPEVQRARRALFEEGCTAGCFNHSLYEFRDSTGLPFIVGGEPGSPREDPAAAG